jgi:hypothetical protein
MQRQKVIRIQAKRGESGVKTQTDRQIDRQTDR